MQSSIIESINLTPELQKRLTSFETDRDAYIGLQEKLTAVINENQRLNKKANELEGQANRTDASWKSMAKSGTIEQDKINDEIERSAQLKKEANALRLTAEARSGIQSECVVQLAEARMKLVGVPEAINKTYWQALLAKALGQEGLRETLLELFALSRALFLKSLDEHDGPLSRCNSQRERQAKTQELTWVTFGKELEKLFAGAEQDVLAPSLVTMPPSVSKEVLVSTPGELRKLQHANAMT